jgi:catechol 2,3-dioxygenase-like lactoylglutathione lyase family enzyme
MITRFDHAVIAVPDLDAAIDAYARLGFAVSRGGRHPGRGTANAIIRFGLEYLELLAVADEREARAAGMGDAELDAFRRGGLLDFALASDDLATDAARLRSVALPLGLSVGGPFVGSRRRPDGALLAWQTVTMERAGPTGQASTAPTPPALPTFAHVRDPWPFLIHWETPDAERTAGDQAGAQPNGTTGVWGLAVIVRELDAAIDVYSRGLGLPLTERAALDALAAERARFILGDTRLDLLAPRGQESILAALETGGEGPFALTLATPDLAATRRYVEATGVPLGPALLGPDESLIAPEAACGARLALRQLRA